MRILIYGINYYPELTGIGKYTGEMAEWFADQGHAVRVITAPPYYPEWHIKRGYTGFFFKREKHNGVDIIRCPLWIPQNPNGLKRLLHLASFAISSFWVVIWQAIKWRPDWIFVVEPPLFAAPSALFAAKISRAKACLHIQDFEVDAAFDLNILKSDKAKRIVVRFERWLMREFDKVTTISMNMLNRLAKKGVKPESCVLFPNWVEVDRIYPLEHQSPLRVKWGFTEKDVIVLYSGSMGMKHGLEIVIDAAKRLVTHPFIHFVVCGDGIGKLKLNQSAQGLPNVSFKPLQPRAGLNELLNLADIHVLPQRIDAADLVLPSKLTNMLASGRPVVATVNSDTEIWKILKNSGLCVQPNDVEALTFAITKLALNPELRKSLGSVGRKYAKEDLAKEQILKSFEQELSKRFFN